MKTSYESKSPAAIRKRLLVPKTNLADETISIEYLEENDRIVVKHQVDTDNLLQIQGDSRGVFMHKLDNGVWTTIPTAVNAGGTGAISLPAAMQNLEIAYRDGDVYAVSGAYPLYGYITENSTQLWFTIITPRRMRAGSISRVTIGSLSAILRGEKGYLDSNSASRNLLASPFSATPLRLSENTVRIIVTKSGSAFSNATNNTPITLQATFSLTFRA